MRAICNRAAVGLLVLLSLAVVAPAARAAEFGIAPGSLTIRSLGADGLPDDRAGAHPDRVLIDFTMTTQEAGTASRDLIFDLSPGLSGNPDAVPACPRTDFGSEEVTCPADTQIGEMKQNLEAGESLQGFPIYNVEPAPGGPAEFAARFASIRVPMGVSLRPDDHGLTLGIEELIAMPSVESSIELWGVPADHQGEEPTPRRPFLTLPTTCTPLGVDFRARSWEANAPWFEQSASTPSLEGCGGLSFEPHLSFSVTDSAADSPTGAEADLSFPQNEEPEGLAPSQVRSVKVEMPAGMSISPGGANGLLACTDAQFGLGQEGAPSCPPASKVGEVTVESAESAQPLDGQVYLGQELPGERFRLFLVAAGAGTEVKLAGALEVDPESGRIGARLTELPQLPVTHIGLSFDGGSRALLTTPLECGPTAAEASFDPYGGGASVESTVPLTIAAHTPGTPCAKPPFAPEIVAGTSSPIAGHPTSFSMTLYRHDGEQLPNRFSVRLPSGLSPAIGTVETCTSADAAAGACPAASAVGTALAEVGSGPSPAALEGTAYLTGPYREAPFGLALVFDARIGPFDLGKLVVRGVVKVDSLTGRATIETDALPETFEGMPLRFQAIGLDLNRPGFLHNPTSCARTKVSAIVEAGSGASAKPSAPFALKGCSKLSFRPRVSVSLQGSSQLGRGGRPDLLLSARLPGGSTHLRSVGVLFPRQLGFEIGGLGELCSRYEALRGHCPAGSRVGTSVAHSSLLGEELSGPVYAVQPKKGGPPDLWASIEGSGVLLSFRGETAEQKGRTKVTLGQLPDLPLSAFTMKLDGGADGIVSLRSGLCTGGKLRRIAAPVSALGQDGARRQLEPAIRVKGGCGGEGRGKKRVQRRVTPPAR